MSGYRTTASVTWCPGCGNFEILNSVEAVLTELVREGFKRENFIIVSGVGNHAKIVDYLDLNSFNSIHGRAIPVAEAIKLAKRDTKVICFAGDGDTYAEGLEHLIFAAKRNAGIVIILHNNRTYGLATGQFTPTSQKSYKGGTMPYGSPENPFNPLELLLSAGATFIGRGYPVRKDHFRKLLKDAILHEGFSFIDVLQVCVTYNNLYSAYNEHVKEIEVKDPADVEEARKVIRSWDYMSTDVPIVIGKFYEADKPGYEEEFIEFTDNEVDEGERNEKIKQLIHGLI